jgi:hypothetical protein
MQESKASKADEQLPMLRMTHRAGRVLFTAVLFTPL